MTESHSTDFALILAKLPNYRQFLSGDIFIRPLGLGSVNPELVGYLGIPFLATAFSPFQLIDKLDNQKVDQNLANYNLSNLFDFLAPSLTFLILLAAGPLLYCVSLFLLSGHKKSSSLRSSRIRRNLQFKILSLFHLLFLFFNRKLFEGRLAIGEPNKFNQRFFCSSGNLNTSNVCVQTDQLLFSKEQLLKTQKEFCFFDRNHENHEMKNVSSSFRTDCLKSLVCLAHCANSFFFRLQTKA